VQGDKTKVRCTDVEDTGLVPGLHVDKNDTITNKTDLGMTARAGSGNNTSSGGPSTTNCSPTGATTRSTAAAATDYIYAASGNDYVSGGTGQNELLGGPATTPSTAARLRPDQPEAATTWHTAVPVTTTSRRAPARTSSTVTTARTSSSRTKATAGVRRTCAAEPAGLRELLGRTKAVYADNDGKQGDDGA
jgi:hypothetical protein